MDQISKTFNQIFDAIGAPVSALIIIIIGWIIARILKKITKKIINKIGFTKKLNEGGVNFGELISKLVYFFVLIFVFMLALDKLGLTSVLEPVKGLLAGITGFIPNLIGASLVAYIGYMLATIISDLVGLSGETIQNFAPKLKLPENINLVNILKKVVFIFIFIPLLICALNILNLDAISEPATSMLNSFFEAIPKILVATIIIVVFVVGGRFLSELVKDLLNSLHLNKVINGLNLGDFLEKVNFEKVIGNIVYTFIVLFGLITAVDKLEFNKLSEIMNTIINLSGNVLFGLIILFIGNIIANVATNNFMKNDNNKFVGSIIKMAILAIFLAIGLRRMGIADDIINLAFGITLGTIALTIVLSFGLGGREAAGKQMGKILDKFNKK
jgi:hypothetical protein